jgi:hypothetical protein
VQAPLKAVTFDRKYFLQDSFLKTKWAQEKIANGKTDNAKTASEKNGNVQFPCRAHILMIGQDQSKLTTLKSRLWSVMWLRSVYYEFYSRRSGEKRSGWRLLAQRLLLLLLPLSADWTPATATAYGRRSNMMQKRPVNAAART